MTTLVVEELRDTLVQEFTAANRASLFYIRPVLLLYNDPAGTFYIKLYQDETLLASSSLTLAQIKSGASLSDNQYHWGSIRFDLDTKVALKRKTTYKIELSHSGYVFSESSYLGWVKPHEDLINTLVDDFSIDTDYENPQGYEIFTYRNN